jgi:hypothetical protein
MPLLMLADNNPILATGGEIAAIVIGLYSFIFIILTVVFGLTMDATFTWLSEKIKIVRMLRPTVDSVNKTSEALSDGVPPPDDENAIIRTVAAAPLQVHKLDQKVDQVTDKVANFAIEFRARTVQVQTVRELSFSLEQPSVDRWTKVFFSMERPLREHLGLLSQKRAFCQ